MPQKSPIEWTDWTSNPLYVTRKDNGKRGWHCDKPSAGCGHCYAETLNGRFGTGLKFKASNADLCDFHLNEQELIKIIKLNDRLAKKGETAKMFLCDMTDIFLEQHTDEMLDKIFAVMALCPNITFQVLTKRAERMRAYLSDPQVPFRVAKAIDQTAVSCLIQQTAEEIRPIALYPHYFVSNLGTVYSSNGSQICLNCGKTVSGRANKKYCSRKCGQAAHYHKSQGGTENFKSTYSAMSPDESDEGYQRVMLYKNGISCRVLVHHLVLETFVRMGLSGEQGCHRDGDPTNNHLANLRWGTQSDNWGDQKRHGNFRAYSKLNETDVKIIRRSRKSDDNLADTFNVSATQIRNIKNGKQWTVEVPIEWPLKNCWAGVSVENQAMIERVHLLLQTPAAVHWVSLEPLLGAVDLTNLAIIRYDDGFGDVSLNSLTGHVIGPDDLTDMKVDWVVVGGESGHGARPCDVDWIRSIVEQCKAADVPVFVKQLGSKPVGSVLNYSPPFPVSPHIKMGYDGRGVGTYAAKLKDKKGGDINEWPEDLRVRQMPEVSR